MTSLSSAKALALALACATTATAQAAPIILDGSTYSYRIRPGTSTATSIPGVTFDGTAESFSLAALGGPATNVTIDESQTDLGGGLHSVFISLQADGDLFPAVRESAFINIGFAGNDPLDLLGSARLLSAVLSLYAGNALIGSLDFVSFLGGSFSSLNPWDGYFLAPSLAGGFLGVGGQGIDRVELTFGLQEVPEPQTLALVAGSLLLLGATRRRRS